MWLDELNSFKSTGITAIGTVNQLKSFCREVGKSFISWFKTGSCSGIAQYPSNFHQQVLSATSQLGLNSPKS
jgi:hypothetical protein